MPMGYDTNWVFDLLKSTPSSDKYDALSESTVIDTRESHWENADSPIEETDFPIVTDAIDVQLSNALAPMVVTESGIVKDVSL